MGEICCRAGLEYNGTWKLTSAENTVFKLLNRESDLFRQELSEMSLRLTFWERICVWRPCVTSSLFKREDRKLHRWYFHNLPVQINTVEDGWHILKAGSDEDDSPPELQLVMMMMSMRGEAANVHNADANSIRSPDTTSNGLCVGSI